MTRFRFEKDFDLDPKDYWDLFLSDEYNRDLFSVALRMKEWRVVESKDDGKLLTRVVKVVPAEEIPAAFAKLVPAMGYTERDRLDRARSVMDVVIEIEGPESARSKFDWRATYTVQPLGPGRCKRVFEGDVKVAVMLVGGQIEKMIVDRLRQNYVVTDDVTARWVTKWKERRAAAT